MALLLGRRRSLDQEKKSKNLANDRDYDSIVKLEVEGWEVGEMGEGRGGNHCFSSLLGTKIKP